MNHASGKAEGMKHEKTPEGNKIVLTISRSIKRKWQGCQTGKFDGFKEMHREFLLEKTILHNLIPMSINIFPYAISDLIKHNIFISKRQSP
jgi:hypothetical protein